MPLELAIAADSELAAQRRKAMTAAGASLPGPPEAVATYLAAEQRLGRVSADVDPREAAMYPARGAVRAGAPYRRPTTVF